MLRPPFFLAKGFVAAETVQGTIPVLRQLHDQGLRTTVDLLGEHVQQRDRALAGRDAYVQLLQALATATPLERNISIKLSMIGQVIDEDFCLANLEHILEVARQSRAFVRLDMEHSAILDSTLRLFEAVYPDYRDHVGVVLQAYLRRTEDDIARMCALGARVRLCKGAYREPADLAWQKMPAIRERFVVHMKTLLRHGHYPAIATHDDRLIKATQAFARASAIDASAFEFQMLYGLRPRTQRSIVTSGYRMRVYVPCGTMWLPYYARRLRERPENILFLLRNMWRA